MPEQKKEVSAPVIKTFRVDYVCDMCGKGRMVASGQVAIMCFSPKYPHVCDNCGAASLFTVKYPEIRREAVEVSDEKQ